MQRTHVYASRRHALDVVPFAVTLNLVLPPMPLKCPACQTQIRYDGTMPEPNLVYRCHVCHLELVLDVLNQKLIVAPFPPKDRSQR